MPRLLAMTFLLALLACRRDAAPPAGAMARPAAQAGSHGAPQDSGFGGTTAPLDRTRPPHPGAVATLRAVDTPVAHPSPAVAGLDYDRIVFEFAADSVPGYHVEYARTPVQRCGSGDPVSVTGTARLTVRFESARAHDDQGRPASLQRHQVLGLPAVKEITLVCDFEGHVEWVLGVATSARYRVSELTGPARLVLDVKHGP